MWLVERTRSLDASTDARLIGATMKPLEITVSAHTNASVEEVLGAASDFTARRSRLWPNVKARHLEVHDCGPDFADATEGTWIVGLFWERSRYDWSHGGAVRGTVTESNVLEPGSTFELRAVPDEAGTAVEMMLRRTFRTGPKGRIGAAVNRVLGARGWSSYLRRVLRNLERERERERERGAIGERGATAGDRAGRAPIACGLNRWACRR